MRLDKYLTECVIGSRKEVKKIIDSGAVSVNEKIVSSPKENVNEEKDIVKYKEEIIKYKKFRYYILNKISGYITAVDDPREKTVMDILPDWVIKKDLAPVGRLDKDTEGLLLLTNDGQLNHRLLSPKSHVDKTYYAELEKDISEDDLEKLRKGVDIGGYITMPAEAKKINIS